MESKRKTGFLFVVFWFFVFWEGVKRKKRKITVGPFSGVQNTTSEPPI